jgi:hypothetical protein
MPFPPTSTLTTPPALRTPRSPPSRGPPSVSRRPRPVWRPARILSLAGTTTRQGRPADRPLPLRHRPSNKSSTPAEATTSNPSALPSVHDGDCGSRSNGRWRRLWRMRSAPTVAVSHWIVPRSRQSGFELKVSIGRI